MTVKFTGYHCDHFPQRFVKSMYIATTKKIVILALVWSNMHTSIMHVAREQRFFSLDTYVSREDFYRTKFDWRA